MRECGFVVTPDALAMDAAGCQSEDWRGRGACWRTTWPHLSMYAVGFGAAMSSRRVGPAQLDSVCKSSWRVHPSTCPLVDALNHAGGAAVAAAGAARAWCTQQCAHLMRCDNRKTMHTTCQAQRTAPHDNSTGSALRWSWRAVRGHQAPSDTPDGSHSVWHLVTRARRSSWHTVRHEDSANTSNVGCARARERAALARASACVSVARTSGFGASGSSGSSPSAAVAKASGISSADGASWMVGGVSASRSSSAWSGKPFSSNAGASGSARASTATLHATSSPSTNHVSRLIATPCLSFGKNGPRRARLTMAARTGTQKWRGTRPAFRCSVPPMFRTTAADQHGRTAASCQWLVASPTDPRKERATSLSSILTHSDVKTALAVGGICGALGAAHRYRKRSEQRWTRLKLLMRALTCCGRRAAHVCD